jgi:hypothetical protein
MTSFTGNLVPAGQEAYLTITLTGNTNKAYHPSVTMTTGVGEFLFDILTNCTGGNMGCMMEGGNSIGLTAWETKYTAGNASDTGFIPIPAVGTNGAIIIHVYRKPGLGVTCNNYTLNITN